MLVIKVFLIRILIVVNTEILIAAHSKLQVFRIILPSLLIAILRRQLVGIIVIDRTRDRGCVHTTTGSSSCSTHGTTTRPVFPRASRLYYALIKLGDGLSARCQGLTIVGRVLDR